MMSRSRKRQKSSTFSNTSWYRPAITHWRLSWGVAWNTVKYERRPGRQAVGIELDDRIGGDVLGAKGLIVVDLVVRGLQGVHLVVAEALLTVVHPVARVTEQFGDAGEIRGVLELAVGVQEVEDLVFIRKHPKLPL